MLNIERIRSRYLLAAAVAPACLLMLAALEAAPLDPLDPLETTLDVRTLIHHGPDGMHVIEERVAGVDEQLGTGTATGAPEGSGVQWTNNVATAVYTSGAIAKSERHLFAGTYLNPPKEAQLFPLDGPAVPDWAVASERFDVAAAHDADVLAGVDYFEETVTLYKWHSGSATPDWSYEIPQATLAQFRPVIVSADGSTIAVLVTFQGGEEIQGRLLYFDSGSSTPLGTFDAAQGTFARNLSISENGAYIAFIATATIYVVDRDADAQRYSGSAGATNDPISISGDGSVIAYGWSSLFVRTWNGSTYGLTWSRPGGGRYLSACALSTDGSTLAAGWHPLTYDRNRIELFDLPSSVPAWTYDYDQAVGTQQDLPRDIAVTANGSHVAVASWSDQGNTNDEVHVFAHDGPTPVLTVDTPGSMFDIDIARGPGGVIHVAAAGKHVHANTTGNGGDLYSIRVETDCVADLDGDRDVDFQDLLLVLTAWGPCAGCVADMDGNDVVDFQDLLILLAMWGSCGPG